MIKAINWFLPEGRVKNELKQFYNYFHKPLQIYNKIAFLPIIDSGLSKEGIPFVRLNNNLIFYGYKYSNQKYLYKYADESVKDNVKESAFGVAQDIIYRYFDAYEYGRGHNKQRYYSIKNGDTVLDIGAYIGFWTIKVSRIVGENGRVIAIEADKENLKILRKNIKANSLKNVTIVPKGVWKEKGKKLFYCSHNQANTLIEKGGNIIQPNNQYIIKVDTVDNILKDLGIINVDFISIEINGSEIESLEGMKETLNQNVNLVITAPYRRFGKPSYETVASILKSRGFNILVEGKGKVYASKAKEK